MRLEPLGSIEPAQAGGDQVGGERSFWGHKWTCDEGIASSSNRWLPAHMAGDDAAASVTVELLRTSRRTSKHRHEGNLLAALD